MTDVAPSDSGGISLGFPRGSRLIASTHATGSTRGELDGGELFWELRAAARAEIVVRVDSEVGWGPGQRVQSVLLSVRRGGADGPLRSARTTVLGVGAGHLPLPLYVGVLASDGNTDTPVWVEALGYGDPSGCTAPPAAVAQRAIVRFARGQTQELPLLLASACLGVTCASDQRCATSGRCESATTAQDALQPFVGTAAPIGVDAGVAVDGRTLGSEVATPVDIGANDVGTDDVRPDSPSAPDDALLPAGDDGAVCPNGQVQCGLVCRDLRADSANCGACGRACTAAQNASPLCSGRACSFACVDGFADCDGEPANGCEADLAHP